MDKDKRIVNFLFEVGTMRKLMRMHRQALLTDDMSDSIASHSYRVAMIGWFLAKEEKADPYKIVMMSLLHDVEEVRSNDHNYIHKKYIKIFEKEINEDQLGDLPHHDLKDFVDEYTERKSKEAILTKDADLLDQVLLLREYEWQGNKEASLWLRGKNGDKTNTHIARLQSETAKKLGAAIYETGPSDWWKDTWTPDNR